MESFDVKKKDLKNFSEVTAGINISKTIYEKSTKTGRLSGRQKKLNDRAIPIDTARLAEKASDIKEYFDAQTFHEITDKDVERLRLFAEYVSQDRKIRVTVDPEAISKKVHELLAMLPEEARKAAMAEIAGDRKK